ncbi:MAG: serine hydrolase domain-containing protein [Phycisphaerales bacterium]
MTAQPNLNEFLSELDAQMSQGIPANDPGAVIAVARDGEIIFREAYGMASLELEVELNPDHVFCIASATKPFTATAILALIDDGALELRDPAVDHLEGINLDPRVTIEHLLTHTSGVPDLFDLDGHGADAQHRAISPEALGAAADGVDLLFEPGTQHHYSNLGYALLGLIVENAADQPLEDFMRERIFERAGMERTMFGGDRRVIPSAVANYTLEGDEFRRAEPLNYSWGYGLGNIFTTVDDLVAFDTALRSGMIIKPKTLSTMRRTYQLEDGTTADHTRGWATMERRGLRFYHHGGGINGWRASIVSIPDHDVFVAVLSNREEENTPVGNIALMVAARIAMMP